MYEQTRQKAEAAAREVANTRHSTNAQQQFNEFEISEINTKMKDYQVDFRSKAGRLNH